MAQKQLTVTMMNILVNQIMTKIRETIEKAKEEYKKSRQYLSAVEKMKSSKLVQMFHDYNEADRLCDHYREVRNTIEEKIKREMRTTSIWDLTHNHTEGEPAIDIDAYCDDVLLEKFEVDHNKMSELRGKVETAIILGQSNLDESFLDNLAAKVVEGLKLQ